MTGEKKFYLTNQGLEKIKKKYEELKKARLERTKGEEAPRILHSEDLDPEYISFKEDINLLDVKIAEVDNILKNTEIITAPVGEEQNIIKVGATITVEIDSENHDEFKIVGTFEANPALGMISNESPVGKALLGHKVGDIITISSPIKTTYRIKNIKYR